MAKAYPKIADIRKQYNFHLQVFKLIYVMDQDILILRLSHDQLKIANVVGSDITLGNECQEASCHNHTQLKLISILNVSAFQQLMHGVIHI